VANHDHIIRALNEAKQSAAKNKIAEAVELLKGVCPDLPAQERYDLMSVIFDLEDIQSRKPE
jgi:uncharacterized protein (UPF0147 family)